MTTEGVSRRARLTEQLALLSVVGAGFLVQGMATISGVLSARLLGVEGRGEIAFVVALGYMASQLTLGGSLSNTVTKRLADRGVTARDGLRHLIGRWLALGSACALAFGAFFVFINRDNLSRHIWLLGGAVVVLSVQNMAQRILTSSMLGEDSPKVRIATAALAPQALTTIAILALFFSYEELTAVEVAAVMVGASAIAIAGSLFLMAKPTHEPDSALDGKDLWNLT